uniref:Thioredoxin n=1 Tax=Cucumis sativus TaxID=3659 RepID=A0A0A0LLJ2_CUCSA
MAEEGQVIGIHNVKEFDEQVRIGKEARKLIVVDFTASWRPPCRFIAPIFAELAKKNPHAIFLKVDVDEVRAIAARFNVDAMPTFAFVRDEVEVSSHRIVGADKNGLMDKVIELCGPVPSTSTA